MSTLAKMYEKVEPSYSRKTTFLHWHSEPFSLENLDFGGLYLGSQWTKKIKKNMVGISDSSSITFVSFVQYKNIEFIPTRKKFIF